jgi:acyl transferase domain-containing protein
MVLVNATVPAVQEKQSEQRYLLQTLGRLWQSGVPIEWPGFYKSERRQRLPLPTYPFERQNYWLEMRKGPAGPINMPGTSTRDTISNLPKKELADWFYLPGWKQVAPVQETTADESNDWLFFLDDCHLGRQMAEQLRSQGAMVSVVLPGTRFARLGDDRYTVRLNEREDYDELFRDLRSRNKTFRRIVHLWNVSDKPAEVEQVLKLWAMPGANNISSQ